MTEKIRPAIAAYVFGVFGVFLVSAPWTEVWETSTLVWAWTPFGAWIRNGWTRGAVTGIGILDLLAAFSAGRTLWRSMREDGGAETG